MNIVYVALVPWLGGKIKPVKKLLIHLGRKLLTCKQIITPSNSIATGNKLWAQDW